MCVCEEGKGRGWGGDLEHSGTILTELSKGRATAYCSIIYKLFFHPTLPTSLSVGVLRLCDPLRNCTMPSSGFFVCCPPFQSFNHIRPATLAGLFNIFFFFFFFVPCSDLFHQSAAVAAAAAAVRSGWDDEGWIKYKPASTAAALVEVSIEEK